ncbi:hypothetical protein HMPREF9946_00105 [Acetobacteraceae bacterium AT-5844]|nr:hypothetical protein HMPREF9946_00105 [Acetobacteraceae bacterium AT-5844]
MSGSQQGVPMPAPLVAAGDFPLVTPEQVEGLRPELDSQAGRIGDLEAGQTNGLAVYASWADLAAATATVEAAGAEVDISDTGSHVDPVKPGSQVVPNSGRYAWRVSASAWERIGDSAALIADRRIGAVEAGIEGLDSLAAAQQQAIDAIPARSGTLQPGEMVRATDRRKRRYFGIDKKGKRIYAGGQYFELRDDGSVEWFNPVVNRKVLLSERGITTDGVQIGWQGGALRSTTGGSKGTVSGGRLTLFAHLDKKRRSVMRYGPDHFAVAGLWVERHPDGSFSISTPKGRLITVSATGKVLYTGNPVQAAKIPGAHLALKWANGRISAFRIDPVDGALRLIGKKLSLPTSNPPDIRPFFSDTLHGITGEPVPIYLSGLLKNRNEAHLCQMSLGSTTGAQALTGDLYSGDVRIDVDTGRLSNNASLVVRPRDWRDGARAALTLSVATAPRNPSVPPSPNVLLLGDSITNRGAAWIMEAYLRSLGYAPNFIGTLRGTAGDSLSTVTDGLPGEGREGHTSQDFDYTRTTRVIPLPPGQEASYLEMAAADKGNARFLIPWLRAETSGDPAGDVRNGYIVDWNYYQSRFAGLLNLPTPDIVVMGLGTNDVGTSPGDAMSTALYDADMLMYRRLKAAWPTVKIIRMMPGTARSTARDALWTSTYVKAIAAMRKAVVDASKTYSGITLAPTWAMAGDDTGYTLLGASRDPETGSVTTTPNDAIHPIGSARIQLWKAVAGYIAVAATR